tara:strand:- start:1151 stop:1405 length:255 start_codon:yes stop_codon:yes gene_type:complete
MKIEIEAKDLKVNQIFFFTKRKNSKKRKASKIEIITGCKWEDVINSKRCKDGDLFLMGQCGSDFAGQTILGKNEKIYIDNFIKN